MKNTSFHRNSSMTVCLFLIVFSLCGIAKAGVASMSREQQVEVDNKRYRSITVKCSDRRNRLSLVKPDGEEKWCDSQLSDVCHKNKLKAAQFSCSSSRAPSLVKESQNKTDLIDAQTQQSKRMKDQLRIEKAAIEESLINIKQAQLTLRRKELEIQKQLLNGEPTRN